MSKFYRAVPVLFFISLFISCPLPQNMTESLINSMIHIDAREKSTDWTVMYYVDGDCNLESYLLQDIYELSQGMESTEMMNVIALVDRIPSYSSDSSILGSNFTDSRLFRIGADEIYPLEGGAYFSDIGMAQSGEYNMGDAHTLKTFIEYCKANYPADHYALIFTNHGGGVKGASGSTDDVKGGDGIAGNLESLVDKAICYDATSDDDTIYTAEMTNVLDSRHSVDLMVYDACVMGLLEIAYQYRPESAGGEAGEFSADYMVASVPNVWGYGLPYDRVFARISETKTGNADHDSTVVDGGSYTVQYLDPAAMTGEEFGRIFVEEQEWDTQHLNPSSSAQSFSLYNLDYADDVVLAFDSLSAGTLKSGYDADTLQTLRTTIGTGLTYYDSVSTPHFDLYQLAVATGDSDLQTAVDSMVAASFGEFSGFTQEGKHGLGFFFTNGNTNYYSSVTGETKTAWAWQYWYTGESFGSSIEYGQLAFCQGRSGFASDTVDSWFELMQYLYNPESNNTADFTEFHPGFY